MTYYAEGMSTITIPVQSYCDNCDCSLGSLTLTDRVAVYQLENGEVDVQEIIDNNFDIDDLDSTAFIRDGDHLCEECYDSRILEEEEEEEGELYRVSHKDNGSTLDDTTQSKFFS